ncbi:MAG: BspA family leucine-rich repeat surface protein [Lachnospiraceae bacterium]|nr:BspA family leucine-rich repeat surface protein [Lachnospiraceae bacterium]
MFKNCLAKKIAAAVSAVLIVESMIGMPVMAHEDQTDPVESLTEEISVQSANSTVSESATGVDVSEELDGSVLADYDSSTGVLKIYTDGDSGTKTLCNGFMTYEDDLGLVYEGTRITSVSKNDFKKVIIEDGVKAPENSQLLFANFRNAEEMDVSGLDTSNVTEMSSMFRNCSKIESLDLTGFDTSKVERLVGVFAYCESLKEIDVSNFNTENVTNMTFLFAGCRSIKSIDISSFDTSNVTNMILSFYNCDSLEKADLSGLDTRNVKFMSGLFLKCPKLESVDLSGISTENTLDYKRMFSGCSSLKELDISSFDLTRIDESAMNDFLYGLDDLEKIVTPAAISEDLIDKISVVDSEGNIRSMQDEDGNKYQYLPSESKTLYLGDYVPESKRLNNPYSDLHKNDGSSAESVSRGNAKFAFDPSKSTTIVANGKFEITEMFNSAKNSNEYDPSAKHRYTTDNKKLAKVNKSGVLRAKKSGEINISLEQKVKGGNWKQIGSSIHLYVQKPEMEKKADLKNGNTADAYSYLSKTTYAPTSWISTNSSVATVDDNGNIKALKKGTTKIIAVYGEGKSSSKKKYKTKLKVSG